MEPLLIALLALASFLLALTASRFMLLLLFRTINSPRMNTHKHE
jgi:hypothetical protein